MDQVEAYSSNNTVTVKDTLDVLEAHSKFFRWTKGERVLDIGCGPGDVTANIVLPFIPKDCSLVGCDLSEGMVENCKKYEIEGRLTFRQLDIQQKTLNNGWENASFNKIFSFYCLHWITDPNQAMKNIYSLLKPGGEILLVYLTPDNAVYISFEILKKLPKWNCYLKDVKWFFETNDSIAFCENLLEGIGFQQIKCYLKKTSHRISSWEVYMELVKSVNPFMRHIPDEMIKELTEELEDVLKQQTHIRFDNVGDLTIDCNLIIATAKKIEGPSIA